ncbi:hypothetical protein [Bosea sp. NBC_00550]|uniref:hypothetical protein n=1 Tax=Bosea sp. NBC_00550 TaxID=2969621 RepID=UPI0022328E80|nr:hypothetical protein [Bosea sp. NBC_00550]UZF92074.1 hypothetical protein NWE53_23800 [Bosea sp. NBC_00550]
MALFKDQPMPKRIDFGSINAAALHNLRIILQRFLPGGVVRHGEYIVRNPRRADRHAGSFRVNIRSGRWADFAVGDAGGDPISLIAYLQDISQTDAALALARMLNVEAYIHG